MLIPLLFALAFSPALDALPATGVGVRAGGVWAGAFLLMDDVTLAAESYDDLKALVVALWGVVLALQSRTVPWTSKDFRRGARARCRAGVSRAWRRFLV